MCALSVFIIGANNIARYVNTLGAQNLSQFDKGAYTGEVSSGMLNDFACDYVIVGHSERRALYGETNEIVAEKYMAAQRAGITPILCVGETLEQREWNYRKNY